VERRVAHVVLVGKPEGKSPLGKLNEDGKMKFKNEITRYRMGLWTGMICLRTERDVGLILMWQ
jgi:hypothetical protein